MLKITTLSQFFKCGLCQALLDNPVGLPCVETVCKKHVEEYLKNLNEFTCPFCSELHIQPPNGFPTDKRMLNMLNYEVDKIDFYKVNPKFKDCNKALNELNIQIEELKLIEQNPMRFVNSYFDKIINQVALQKELLKEAIDDYSVKTIEQIKKVQKEFPIQQTSITEISNDLAAIISSLNLLNTQFKSFDLNDVRIDEIIKKVAELKIKSDSEFEEFRNTLLSDKWFKFDQATLNIEEILGYFTKKEVFPKISLTFFNI